MKEPAEVFDVGAKSFEMISEGHYRLTAPLFGLQFDVDRLRRDRHELVGELAVKCDIAGALTVNGVLSVADFNLSSARARQDRGKLLAARARVADDFDWPGLLEEFCQRVLGAERTGQPAVSLRDLPRPEAQDDLVVDGVYLPRRHPGILFADGGGLKSYWLAYALGQLNRRGFRVGFFDWELSGEDHRDRLERLFGADMPDIKYVRCDRPLVYEVDRLKRIREEEQLDYLGFDSVTFACDGPPEAAEVAAAYFRAVRQMGVIGSLHVAHITKADGGDQKPFGSAFWHNGARSTWFAKRTDDGVMEQTVTLGIFPRKANLGPRRPAVGVEFAFGAERTIIRATSLADVQDLASQLPIRQRMAHLLRSGAMSTKVLAEELSEKLDTVERTARRYKNQFVLVKGHDGSSRLGLLESRPA